MSCFDSTHLFIVVHMNVLLESPLEEISVEPIYITQFLGRNINYLNYVHVTECAKLVGVSNKLLPVVRK